MNVALALGSESSLPSNRLGLNGIVIFTGKAFFEALFFVVLNIGNSGPSTLDNSAWSFGTQIAPTLGMAATVWKGYISFGLVSIPVRGSTVARAERPSVGGFKSLRRLHLCNPFRG
jgi:hypothetical protein